MVVLLKWRLERMCVSMVDIRSWLCGKVECGVWVWGGMRRVVVWVCVWGVWWLLFVYGFFWFYCNSLCVACVCGLFLIGVCVF